MVKGWGKAARWKKGRRDTHAGFWDSDVRRNADRLEGVLSPLKDLLHRETHKYGNQV